MTSVTTYYLEMLSPDRLNKKAAGSELTIRESLDRDYRLNKSLYQRVGKEWRWTDKLSWTDTEWREYAASGNLRTWVAYYLDEIAGYFELLRQETGNVEIIYFGLCHECIGRGFGGYLLSRAIDYAWNWEGTRRVWVHTCTLDHPAALNNYLARGMTIYQEETTESAPPHSAS